jgi:hypothetical protein
MKEIYPHLWGGQEELSRSSAQDECIHWEYQVSAG